MQFPKMFPKIPPPSVLALALADPASCPCHCRSTLLIPIGSFRLRPSLQYSKRRRISSSSPGCDRGEPSGNVKMHLAENNLVNKFMHECRSTVSSGKINQQLSVQSISHVDLSTLAKDTSIRHYSWDPIASVCCWARLWSS